MLLLNDKFWEDNIVHIHAILKLVKEFCALFGPTNLLVESLGTKTVRTHLYLDGATPVTRIGPDKTELTFYDLYIIFAEGRDISEILAEIERNNGCAIVVGEQRCVEKSESVF